MCKAQSLWLQCSILLYLVLSGASHAAQLNVRNAEDFAPIANSDWVIASSMAGGDRAYGELIAIDAKSGTTDLLYPTASSAADISASQQVAGGDFAPHGIALGPKQQYLYVVNHGGRESIEVFELSVMPTPKLRWLDFIELPKGAFANSVAVSVNSTVFISNMGVPIDGSPAISAMGGNIISWQRERGWATVDNSEVIAPNGILVSDDASDIYVASWSTAALVKLSPKTHKRRSLSLAFLPDNLRWADTGDILVGGQNDSPEAISQCYVSKQNSCHNASAIAVVEPRQLALKCSQAVDIGMATVAAEVGDNIWVGTTRGDHFLSIAAAPLFGCDIPPN